jgi:hypothetical protein
MDGLDRVGDLHQLADGGVGISESALLDELHAAAWSSLSTPRATILSASSGNGRCNAFASSHGARNQTSGSSSVVRITGIAFGWIDSMIAFGDVVRNIPAFAFEVSPRGLSGRGTCPWSSCLRKTALLLSSWTVLFGNAAPANFYHCSAAHKMRLAIKLTRILAGGRCAIFAFR